MSSKFVSPPGREILECISDEMDLRFKAPAYPWRLRIRQESYTILKDYDQNGRYDWQRELFYEKDGYEYIRAWDNQTMPFMIHYRVVLDNSLPLDVAYGTMVELDDELEPDVKGRRQRDFDEYVKFRESQRNADEIKELQKLYGYTEEEIRAFAPYLFE